MLDAKVEVLLWVVEAVDVTVEAPGERVLLRVWDVVVVLMLPDVGVLLLVELADDGAGKVG